LQGETIAGERYVVTHADGSDVTIIAAASLLMTAGRVTGAVTVWHDVTAQVKAQAQIEESQRLLDALMEYVPEGIVIADAPDLRLRMVSR
jgi:PAS domain-containing protein